jgi:predicted Zn-dependent protease
LVRLTPHILLLLVAALALGGCATTYPPPRDDTPAPEVPRPEQPDADEPEVVPERRPDPSAPTLALVRQSERSAEDGDLDGAIAYVERAIRLDSRNSQLWLRLARLQLAAERPGTAEQLAHKAIALADDDAEERQGWLLVADALEAQGDDEEAARIRARWRTYRG